MKRKGSIVLIVLILVIISWSLLSCALSQERRERQLTSKHSSQFTIKKLAITEDVKNREPVGISDTFPSTTEKVYCFLEAVDIAQDTQMSFVWYLEGKKMHSYELPIKQGSRWRTFSSKNLYSQKGNWKVEIKDSDGNTIKSVSFKVE